MVGRKLKLLLMALITSTSLLLSMTHHAQASSYYQESSPTHHYQIAQNTLQYKICVIHRFGYRIKVMYTYYCGVPIRCCIISCEKIPEQKHINTIPDHEVEIEDSN